MIWGSVLVLLAVLAGHVVLVRAVMDTLSRSRMPRKCFLALLPFIGIAAAVVPVLLVREVGLRGLWPSNGLALPMVWRVYASVCLLTAAIGIGVAIYVQLRFPLAVQVAMRVRQVDIAAELGRKPAGPGWRGLASRLPFNELYQPEVIERELCLPRAPAAWDGLSILHLSDLHFNGTPARIYFERTLEIASELKADLIALTGDILEKPSMCEWIASTLAKLQAPLGCYFVLGNHEIDEDPEPIRAAMKDAGWIDIAEQAHVLIVRGHKLAVMGTERPFIDDDPDFSHVPADAFRLLLIHTPYLINWARKRDIDLMLSGHLHGGQIRLPLLGPLRGGWYNSGLFHKPPTVLHVSRALGQLTPFRFRCPPEMTKIIFRA